MEKRTITKIIRQVEETLGDLRNDLAEMANSIPKEGREQLMALMLEDGLRTLEEEQTNEYGPILTTGMFQAILWTAEIYLKDAE